MDNISFENLMRQGEAYHSLRLPPDNWVVIRVDGHGFSRFTAAKFSKPFDLKFHHLMVRTAQALLEEFGGIYAYTESDEISLLLPHNWSMFDRSLEKVVSLSAAAASSVFSGASGHQACFDSRVWLGADEAQVVDYFRWRQDDGGRCALNGWCYWTMRQNGQTYKEATNALDGQTPVAKRSLLQESGIDFDQVPLWQQRGVGLHWERYAKQGFDPIKGEEVTAYRRRIAVDTELPVGDEYSAYVTAFLKAGNNTA